MSHRTAQKLNFEQVEDRRLMSASPWGTDPVEVETVEAPQAEIVSHGSQAVLSIEGTTADEQITVEPLRRGRQVRVQVVDQATDTVTLERYFSARELDFVQIDAGAGNDHVIQSTRLSATVNGGAGDDGLYSRSESELVGGAGTDRFLIAHSQRTGQTGTPVDQAADEVQIHLHDGARKSVDVGSGREGQWGRGRFQAQEVAVLDQVFAQLQERTDNQRLLETASGNELHFHRHGRQLSGDPIGAWKEGGSDIHLTESTFATDTQAQQIVLHEIGHNWDDPQEHELADEFRTLSGWRPTSGSELYCAAGDVHWTYDAGADASFARDYGRENPMEDFATSFAAYFLGADYPGASGEPENHLADKLAVIDTMLSDIQVETSSLVFSLSDADPDDDEVHAWWPENVGGGALVWNGGW